MKVGDIMNKNLILLSEEENIAKAVELMAKNRIHQIPIVNDKFEGMVYIKDVLKVKSDLTKTSVKKIIKKTAYLKPDYDLEKAIKLLLEVGERALPVVEKDKIVGILSEVDVLTKGLKIRNFYAEDVMNKPIVIDEKESLKKAISIMEKNNISSLPIINWEEKLVGCVNIFSFAELIAKEKESIESMKSAKEKISFFDNPVKNFSFYPKTCNKREDLEKIVSYFNNYEEVIVVENEKPIGIIKPRDILSLLFEKEKVPLVVYGMKMEEAESVFSGALEKWKKMGVERIILAIEKIGAKEKYDGKIKVLFRGQSFMISSTSYDKLTLVKELRDLVDRKIVQQKEIREKRRRIKEV